MSPEEHKARAYRLYDGVFTRHDVTVLDELVSEAFVDHDAPAGVQPGREGLKQTVALYLTAFPDLAFTIEDQLAEGDRVATRFTARATHRGPFMGIAPTGRPVEVEGIAVDRFADGKLVESWLQYDRLGLLQQLGVVPAGAMAPPR
jgi:steroid delta-isomerase-like uncharacterized protein